MPDIADRLRGRAQAAHIELAPAVAVRLVAYFELLRHWNRTINLTALDDEDEAIDRLLLEPISAAGFLPAGAAVVDLGSGGGSPALPLAITLASPRLVMVESRERKAAFLREAVRELDLSGARVESARFEELTHSAAFRESFDVASIRAVRIDSATLLSACGFLVPGGLVALFRGLGGPDRPESAPLQLSHVSTDRLLPSSDSRLTLLRRA